jgi:hypothetical protein
MKIIDKIKNNLINDSIEVEEFIKDDIKFLYIENCIISQNKNCNDLILFIKRCEEKNRYYIYNNYINKTNVECVSYFWTDNNISDIFNSIKNNTFIFKENEYN